jgi:D-alanine-D-alanine ligase-like ATP-grasp enzyme
MNNAIRKKIENEVFAKGYEDMDFSAQIMINEALKRKIKVEVLDRKNNFIRLTKGKKTEYLYDANYTSLDSQICTFIMENKHVSKIILKENGLNVAKGGIFYSEKEALDNYKKFKNSDLIVKPNTTNFGIGINFAKKGNKKEYETAVKYAFKFDKSILVEEFIKGEEYRFLVLGFKVAGVVKRIPANVTGDGVHNIKQLIDLKNNDLKNYKKITDDEIMASEVEANYLKTQGYSFSTILKKGQRVFVRKNSNVATGGDAIDMTDGVNALYKKIAEKGAKSVDAKICGVDIMIQDIKKKPSGKNYCIIELNPNPGLTIHKYILGGKVRPVEKLTLDLLGF